MKTSALVTSGVLGILLVAGATKASRWISDSRKAAQPAIEAAKRSPDVTNVIGEAIVPGRFVTGSILSDGTNGNADLTIPVIGRRGSGKLIEWAQQSEGHWNLCSLVLRLADGREVIVLSDANTTCERE
jgi:hypothetical protein